MTIIPKPPGEQVLAMTSSGCTYVVLSSREADRTLDKKFQCFEKYRFTEKTLHGTEGYCKGIEGIETTKKAKNYNPRQIFELYGSGIQKL